jgi:hypothetical protein
MEKYYTPELEELHVGFEYEHKKYDETIMSGIGGNTWFKDIYSIDSFMNKYYTIFDMDLSRIRVKYLNLEDIASLGFEHLGSGWFKRGNCRVRKWIQLEVDIYLWDEDEENGTGDIKFSGNIKNKNELQQILTQLNIN